MKHKLLRGLVALVLVCVLVVNVSPIRVQAVGVDQFIGVAVDKVGLYAQVGALSTGAAVFAWVLIGLGIIVTTAQAIDLMNQYTEFSGELETSIYYYPDGSWSYGVDMGFVERVRAFLWDSGVLVEGVYLDPAFMELASSALTEAQQHPFYYIGTNLYGEFILGYADCDFYFKSNSNGKYIVPILYPNGAHNHHRWLTSVEQWAIADSIYYTTISLYESGVNDLCYTPLEDTELGYVPLPSESIEEGYTTWYTNAQSATNPDTEEEVTVLPIPLNPSTDTEELPDGVTQEDVWPGSVADPMPETDTDTDTETDTGSDGSLGNTPWETFKKWISEGWKTIIQAIPTADSIAQSIGNVIKSIFVPDADFISEKWNAIRSRFDFADSISSSGELILDVLNGIDPEPPVIYVDLGDAEGSYYLGGQVAFLDLRWYERYKPTGDAIISAFLWLVFVWRMFIKLPGIIGGLPGDFVMQGVTDLGLADRLPARKKEYENQRQENRRFFKK